MNPFAQWSQAQTAGHNAFGGLNIHPFFEFFSKMATAHFLSPKEIKSRLQEGELLGFTPSEDASKDWKAIAEIFAQMLKNNLNHTLSKENTAFFEQFEQPMESFIEQLKHHPLIQGGLKEQANDWHSLNQSFFVIIKSRQALMVVMESIASEAIDAFLQRANAEDKIESLPKMYSLWSRSFDEIFEQMLKQDEYAKLQTEYTNATIKIQSLFKDIQSKILKTLHIPSYKELDSVNKKLHDLNQEVKELKKQLNASQNTPKTKSTPKPKKG